MRADTRSKLTGYHHLYIAIAEQAKTDIQARWTTPDKIREGLSAIDYLIHTLDDLGAQRSNIYRLLDNMHISGKKLEIINDHLRKRGIVK